ncbi:HTH domain-containing protein [Streptococcus hyointestinalis]|uniref:HTH domain-containing protein n=1 Tax=Streptococcus hyointestinalis TaxID=1337 RepID=UPI0013DEA712|nr:HTH domain-containing protein [Streptococcus hyointestinalis]
MNKVKLTILQLLGERFIPTKVIAQLVGKSEKTVRKYVAELNDDLEPLGTQIISKQGKGLHLLVRLIKHF